LDWGWKPHSLTINEKELALLAVQNLDKDPADWGGGGLQPDIPALLEVLAGGAAPEPAPRLILDLTLEQAGLYPLAPEQMYRWRNRVLGQLLVAQAQVTITNRLELDRHFMAIDEGSPLALRLLEAWTDSKRLSRGLAEAILRADEIAGLANSTPAVTAGDSPFLSWALENATFATLCAGLAGKNGRDLLEALAGCREAVNRHARGFWSTADHPRAIPWGELGRLAGASHLLLSASPGKEWASPDDAIQWYTEGGWQVDQAGEEIMRLSPGQAPALLGVLEPLRAAYRARWEGLMWNWTALWEGAGCPVSLTTAGEWLKQIMSAKRPTAILLVDALRYDLGSLLAEQVNQREGATRAEVHPARAPMPSITLLGMAAALPVAESELLAEVVDGKWQVQHISTHSVLSGAAQRRTWWIKNAGASEDNFLSMDAASAGAVPSPKSANSLVIMADDTIDLMGHDDQLQTGGSALALGRYLQVIERLRDAGWRRVIVLTDHGYIQWPSGNEKSVTAPAPDAAYVSRRAVAYPAAQTVDGPQVMAPGGQWRVLVARGASNFRAYGSLGYFHGGASLQEWIIPCLKIEWPVEAKPVGVEIESLPQVLAATPRVTLRVVKENLLVEDALPRQVEVIIRETSSQKMLFRSQPTVLTPDKQTVDVRLEAVPSAEAGRGTKVVIQVRQTSDEKTIASANSILMIEMTGW
jgi:hypothetical protein